MEAWRQRPLGGREEKRAEQNETSIHLTPTGLLMEGDYTHNQIVGEMPIFRQSPVELKKNGILLVCRVSPIPQFRATAMLGASCPRWESNSTDSCLRLES